MAIKTSFNIEDGCLFVLSEGEDESLEEVKDYGIKVLDKAVANGCYKIFCDEQNLEYKLNTLDTYFLGQYISSLTPKSIKVAILMHRRFVETGVFYENVAVNRGLTAQMFIDREEALKWLLED